MTAPAIVDHRQPRLVHVASIPVSDPEPPDLPAGHRIAWLAGAGLFALQRRHHCRDDDGRFTHCRRWCPGWDDLDTATNATPITHLAAERGLTRSAP